MTRLFTSATFASREKIFRLSMNLKASSRPPLMSKVKMDAAAVGEILLVQGVIRVIGQRGVVDLLHLRMVCQEFDHLLGVLHMALDAQAQGLGALQQQECIERGDGGTGIAQQDGADVGNEGGRACGIGEGNTVVAGVGIGDVCRTCRWLSSQICRCPR